MGLFRFLKPLLPRTLFARTLMIIVTPVILAQLVATFVFFDRHWSTMTNRLTYALAGDIGLVAEEVERNNHPASLMRLRASVARHMDLQLDYSPGVTLPATPNVWSSPLQSRLEQALRDRLRRPFNVRMAAGPEQVGIDVQLSSGVLRVLSPERRIFTPTTEVFIGWMLGSSILLSVIALIFMRNQIRPVRRLAAAAEAFGKGRNVPGFKPEGATEVRQAAKALLQMHNRLRRQITQRTTMLAGISHDLRTPLTRMKLQLAMLPETPANTELRLDVEEMVAMVEAYLAFARGEEGEAVQQVDVNTLLQEVVAKARKLNPQITLSVAEPIILPLRRQAISRGLTNLVMNAVRYGTKADIQAIQLDNYVIMTIDDDGPGIPAESREEVFRPFVRLDEARNTATGSVGLGMTIARDIVRLHGGEISLLDSPIGGLRVHVRLPV